MKNKKKLIIISLILLVVVIGSVIYFTQNKPGNAVTDNQIQGYNFRGNRENFNNVQGKIVSLEAQSMIVDNSTSQQIITWNEQTQFRQTVTASKEEIIKQDAQVLVRYTQENNLNQVSQISLFEQNMLFNPSGRPAIPSGAVNGNRPEGMPDNNDFRSNNNQKGLFTGKITAINENQITLSSLMDSNQTMTFDIASATYSKNINLSSSDLKIGLTVSVNGQKSGDKVLARQITVE